MFLHISLSLVQRLKIKRSIWPMWLQTKRNLSSTNSQRRERSENIQQTFSRVIFFFFHSLTPLIHAQSYGSCRGFSRFTSFLVPAALSTGPLRSWGEIISRNQHGFRSASFVTVSAPLAQHISWTQNHADPAAFTTTLKTQDSVRTREKILKQDIWSKEKKNLIQRCILFKWSLLKHQVLTRCYSGLLIYLPFFFFSL